MDYANLNQGVDKENFLNQRQRDHILLAFQGVKRGVQIKFPTVLNFGNWKDSAGRNPLRILPQGG